MNYLIEEQLIPVLNRFSLRDLKLIVDGGIFPGISWNIVKRTCRARRLDYTEVRDVACAIIYAFNKVKPSTEQAEHTFYSVQFIDSYSHTFLYWYTAHMFNRQTVCPKSPAALKRRILQMFESDYWNAVVLTKQKGDIVFVMQLEKKNTRRIKYGEPFFAAVKLSANNTCHVLFSPTASGVIHDHLRILKRALGYGNYLTMFHINGQDVKNLFRTLQILRPGEINRPSETESSEEE